MGDGTTSDRSTPTPVSGLHNVVDIAIETEPPFNVVALRSDGTVWRFDLTSKDPTQWKGELFFDTINSQVDSSNSAWSKGQPIVVPPTVALDRFGQLADEVATGDQDVFTATGTNYLYSISERLPQAKRKRGWFR